MCFQRPADRYGGVRGAEAAVETFPCAPYGEYKYAVSEMFSWMPVQLSKQRQGPLGSAAAVLFPLSTR